MQNDNIDEIIDGIKSQKSKKGAEKFCDKEVLICFLKTVQDRPTHADSAGCAAISAPSPEQPAARHGLRAQEV